MTTTIEILHTNKRKFISDVEVYPPSARFFSTVNQVEIFLLSSNLLIHSTIHTISEFKYIFRSYRLKFTKSRIS
jgi:hypothetical protein